MDDQVIPSLNRSATIETVVPDTRTRPAAPVHLPTPIVYAPPPAVEQPARPPGDLKKPEPNNPAPAISLFTLGDPASVQSTNLAPDISTYVSSNEPYFQLSSTVAPVVPDTWYLYPSQTGSVIMDNTIPPQLITPSPGILHAFQQTIQYQGQSLMPSTWYLNPSLNGEITLVDASGSELLHSIDGNLYYNNELLARAGDIQQVSAWSEYPALQSVDFNNFGITGASDVTSSTAHIDTLSAGSITATGGIDAGISGIICGGINTGGTGPVVSGDVATTTVHASGAGTFGSVSTTGSGTFGSITSNGIINAASHQIQNATAITVGPSAVGTLSSPDGTVLTWNGNAITTGTEGDAANWANYPAVNTVSGLSTAPLAIQAGATQPLTLTSPDGNITQSANNASINSTAAVGYNVTVDRGTNIIGGANVNVTAQNGGGGNIQLNAQPGYQLGTQQVGFGQIQLNAYGSSNQVLGLGGKIDITAYSGGVGEYGSATSRVSLSAATLALSAGAAPTLPATAGSVNLFGQDIISIVAAPIPPILPQFPESVYIYGLGVPFVAGGVRLESPNGIQLAGNSDLYATDIYPYTSLGLNLKGRASVPGPAADVTIADCASIVMRSAATISDVTALTMAGVGTINGVKAITADTGNLTIQGSGLITPYLVSMANVNTIAFEPSGTGGTGAITNVQTINGVAYPPPLPPIGDVADWALFPAKQAVDMSGNGITNLASIATLTNASITSAGSLGIFSDAADLSLAADNGGNVNIGTGNAGNINIQTAGMGHNLTLAGDTVSITGATDTNITALGGNVNIVASVAVSLQAPVTVGAVPAPQDIALYGNLNASADVVSSSGTNNYSLNTIGALVGGIPSGFRDATEFYVSFDGNDVTGLGSILSPYKTIQKAITQAELVSAQQQICVIQVASGHYVENLTFAKGYVVLNGTLQSQTGNEVCEITGSISIACAGADDVFNRQVTFQGFNLTCGFGQAITDTSTAAHTVTFQDCKCFVVNQFFISTSTATDMRLYLTNVEVQQTSVASTLPVIVSNIGLVECERLDMAIAGNCSAMVIGGTSVLARLSLATLDTANGGTTLLPLLSITSTTLLTHSLGNVAFSFTGAGVKTATNAMFIGSSVATAIIMLNCVFTLLGTASSTNNCIGYNGVGSPNIAGINNTSLSVNVLLPQTTSVQSGIAQTQYINIQPPGLATYSSTADQVIAVSGTPQALTYNTTQFNQGTTLVANSRVYANAQGNYNLSYSVELQHAGIGIAQIATTFLKKNGTTIANTGRQWTITSASFQNAATAEFVVSLNAGDYVEVFFSGDTSLSANATAAAGALPAIPSVVFNIKQFR